MPSDHAFLRQRLALVEHGLASPDKEFVYVGKGRARYRTEPSSKRDVRREREARLLRKLLAQTREGQVLTTLQAWRRQLGEFLAEHRQRYRDMQEAYDFCAKLGYQPQKVTRVNRMAFWVLPNEVNHDILCLKQKKGLQSSRSSNPHTYS